jgi:hypothetical protein
MKFESGKTSRNSSIELQDTVKTRENLRKSDTDMHNEPSLKIGVDYA